jgi:hypothetical protein
MTANIKADSSVARVLILVAATIGCAAVPPRPMKSTGLVFSDEGVHLAVVSQTCNQSGAPHRPKQDPADTTFVIEVGNPTVYPIAVHRDRLLLIPPDGSAIQTSTPEAVESMSVDSGETTTFTLQFLVPGSTCSQAMRLEPNSAIELRGKPINIGAVRFAP